VPDSSANVEIGSAATASGVLRPLPGRAFWLISKAAHRLDTAPVTGSSVPSGAPWPVVLAPGWNQIACPFDFPVAWSSVVRSASVQDLTAFDPTLGTIGDYATAAPEALEPFDGCFVFNAAAAAETLWVPPVEVPEPAPAQYAAPAVKGTTAPAEGTVPSPDHWSLRLLARSEKALDGGTELGTAPDALDLRDAHDRRKPPRAPGAWVSLAIDHSDWSTDAGVYATDLRAPNGSGHRWDLVVRSERSGEPVTIEVWAGTALPDGLGFRLLDLEQGTTNDLGARDAAFRMLSSGATRPYRLVLLAGTPEYLAREAGELMEVPHALTLEPSAPNPSRGPTRIRFGLPRAARVTLDIYDVRGARVARLFNGQPLPAGYHAWVWEGLDERGRRLGAGAYFYRLEADGRAISRKLVLIR
jgi:hypothetical protein